MIDDGRIPRRLTDRHVEASIPRDRICPGPHPTAEIAEAIGGWTCPLCLNTGFLPRDLGVDAEQRSHYGVEPIPFGHPAGVEESWVAGLGAGPRRREP